MLFKDYFIFSSQVAILFGGVEPFGAILVKIEAYEKHLGEIILNLG